MIKEREELKMYNELLNYLITHFRKHGRFYSECRYYFIVYYNYHK